MTMNSRSGARFAAVLSVLFAAVVALLSAPPAAAAPADEVAFLQVLDEQGITYASAGKVLAAGHAVCDYRDLGYDQSETVDAVWLNTDLDRAHSAFFVGLAEAAFCPHHLPAGTTGRVAA